MAKYSIQFRLEQAKALVEETLANCEKEAASLKTELQKAKKETHKAKTQIRNGNAPKNLAALKSKAPFLEMKLAALENAHAEALAAKDKLIALYDEDMRDHSQKTRGLLSYAIATGSATADTKLLFDSLADYLDAKSESDRNAAHKTVNLIIAHGNPFNDKAKENDDIDDRVVAQLESISDEAQRTAFYQKHRDAIHRGLEARKNNP
jgi:hypothetical protein